MKIAIVGSMSFAKEMLETKKKLEEMGHEVLLPHETERSAQERDLVADADKSLAYVLESDAMRKGFENDVAADAILVINHDKNGVKGYIGISSLMEIGLAFYFRKKIFLLYDVPHYSEVRWAHEIMMIQPVILNGDLSKIQ